MLKSKSMKPSKKKVLKFLRKACEHLPEESYRAYHKYIKPRFEKDEKGEQALRMGYLEHHTVNHFRRVKRLYSKYGWTAVEIYFLQRGYTFSDRQEAA